MQSNHFPFPKGWYTAGHGELWNCNSTYCLVPYENLPPLDIKTFQGDFQWLIESADEFEDVLSPEEQEKLADTLNHLIVVTKQHSLKLPDSFIKFIATSELRNRVVSCTNCYFDLSNRLIESPKDSGYLVRFLNDSQNVLHWYLYLNLSGEHYVVVSTPEFLDDIDGETLDDVIIPRDIYYCAPTFEAFIYRFWIENNIWFALTDENPLTKEQQKYIDGRLI